MKELQLSDVLSARHRNMFLEAGRSRGRRLEDKYHDVSNPTRQELNEELQ